MPPPHKSTHPITFYVGQSPELPFGDVESCECPRSRSAFDSGPRIEQIVTEIHKAGWIKEAAGAFPGGLNADDWDAKFHDFVYLLEVQKSRVKDAERDATRQ